MVLLSTTSTDPLQPNDSIDPASQAEMWRDFAGVRINDGNVKAQLGTDDFIEFVQVVDITAVIAAQRAR